MVWEGDTKDKQMVVWEGDMTGDLMGGGGGGVGVEQDSK